MTTITPRWEWRTFGRPAAASEAVFAAAEPSAVAESDEVYFLGPVPEANVKVRDDLIDVKLLREVDADGLERWEPVLKRPFPLEPADAAAAWQAIGLGAMPDVGEPISLDRLLALLEADGRVRVVPVHKRRVRYTIGGCMAERSELRADGHSTTTVAVESTDRTAVVAAVASLGLAEYLNIDYPSGLASLIDQVAPRYAVIDAGTNSIKFHIGERESDGSWRRIADRAEITRMGEGVTAGGALSSAGIERTVSAIQGMVDEARRDHVLAIAAVGTQALRGASNRAEVVATIHDRTRVRISVISGEEEGRLAYLAVKGGLGSLDGSLAVFDTGGGSSQFTFGDGSRVDEQFSVPVGAVRFTERYGLDRATSTATLDEAIAAIAADLARLDGRSSPGVLVGMGGAITNITAVKHALATYDPDIVQGTVLERAEVDRQIELYRARDAADRRSIVGLQPKRADVILAGACIVRTVMTKLGMDALTVSDRGLRHGLLVERFGHEEAPR